MANSKRAKPLPPHAGSVSSYLPTKAGWSTQRAQLGGRPAVVIYHAGKLASGRTVIDGKPLPSDVLSHLPTELQWRGVRSFAIVGQLRMGRFEALAIASTRGKQLISYDSFSGTYLDTPQMHWLADQRTVTRTHDAKQLPVSKKLTPITVLLTLYKNRLLIQWVHREKRKLLHTVRLKRSLPHDVDKPILNTRRSKG